MGGGGEGGLGMTANTGKISQGLGRGHPCKAPGREHANEEQQNRVPREGKTLDM